VRSDLVGEEHLLERDHSVANAETAEMLSVAHHVFRNCCEPGAVHRLDEQRIDLVPTLVGPKIVRVLEVDRVDLLERYEVLDLDRLVALDLDRLEVLVFENDLLLLADLEGLDDLVVGNRLVLELADLPIADRAAVG
jgi:hypothetical protein